MITGREANIIARMATLTPEAEKIVGKAKRTARRAEIAEQKLFGAWLRREKKAGKLNYLWPRSDKPTTIQKGHWDFTVWLPNGRELRLEFKAPGGQLREEQRQTFALMETLDHPVLIVFSAAEAQAALLMEFSHTL